MALRGGAGPLQDRGHDCLLAQLSIVIR